MLFFIMMTFSISLKPSKLLRVAVYAMVCIAVAAFWAFIEPFIGDKVTLLSATIATIIFAGFLVVRAKFVCNTFSETLLTMAENGSLSIRLDGKDGTIRSDQLILSAGCVIWPMLMVLHFRREDDKKMSLIVLPDCTDLVSFQRLRVAMLWLRQRQ